MYYILVHKNSHQEVQTKPFSGKIDMVTIIRQSKLSLGLSGDILRSTHAGDSYFFSIYMYSIYLIEIYIIIKCHMHSI